MKLNTNDFEREFNKNRSKFSEKDLNRVMKNYKELDDKFKNKSKLKKFYNDFKLLFGMIKDYISGDYTEVPWYIIGAIGSALLYVLSPIDLIPDFIPVLGYLDDAAVVAICLKFINEEVNAYKIWKFRYPTN